MADEVLASTRSSGGASHQERDVAGDGGWIGVIDERYHGLGWPVDL